MKEINLAVCVGRHSIPEATDGAVFENEISSEDITRPQILKARAQRALQDEITAHDAWTLMGAQDYDGNELYVPSNIRLNLYVTGLTVAVIAVIEAARNIDLAVMLWHYDRSTGTYYCQPIMG